MLQISRGICQTPGIRASGPSYMKQVSPPVARAKASPSIYPPLVLIHTIANRQLIVAASNEALAASIRVGMTLTEAKALCTNLVYEEHDATRDAKSLEALARWMMRFTPCVSLNLQFSIENFQLKIDSEDHQPDAIFLDLTGCERVFGGISNIVRDVMAALRSFYITSSVAVAPTPGGAWAAASFGESGAIIPQENLRAALAPLPVAALRLSADIVQSLYHLGLETIGHVLKLPRDDLPARFGPTLLLRLDQALGEAMEPLVPLQHHIPIEASMEFDGVVESLEAIWIVFKKLLSEIVAELLKRGCGARQLEVEFRRAYSPMLSKTILLSRASRNIVNLFDLLRCAMETLQADIEFIGISLRVPIFERISEDQTAYTEDDRVGEAEVDHLIARLCTRLGEDVVIQPELVESHVPERSWHGLLTRASRKTPVENRDHIRPLQLHEPAEIHVMVAPSDDRDGRPILFRNGREVHQLAHVIGPERIAGEWWRGHNRTRDYFDVEGADGKRFWVFRVNETHRWFLHGTFS